MRRIFLSISLILLASASGFGSDVVKPDIVQPKETKGSSSNGYVSKPVTAFKAVTIDNEPLSSSAHGARALLISLWGLNCASCLDEMKVLEPFYREFKDQGLKIWAVNTEDIGGKEIKEGLRNKGIEVSYDLIPDPGLEITKLFTSWFIPVTLIVDSEGIVQYYKVGFNEADAEKIKVKVGALLAR